MAEFIEFCAPWKHSADSAAKGAGLPCSAVPSWRMRSAPAGPRLWESRLGTEAAEVSGRTAKSGEWTSKGVGKHLGPDRRAFRTAFRESTCFSRCFLW